MKKFYAVLLVSLLSLTMLTGCGNKDNTNDTTPDQTVTDNQPDGGGMTNGDMPDGAGNVGDGMLDDMEEGIDPNGDGVVDNNAAGTDNQPDTTTKP